MLPKEIKCLSLARDKTNIYSSKYGCNEMTVIYYILGYSDIDSIITNLKSPRT